MPLALGIETSCDDTCVALADERGRVFFNGSQSHNFDVYGGVVPEIAGRNHTFHLLPLVEKALQTASLDQIDMIGVTGRPGLLSSLLTGYVTAQTLSLAWNKPFLSLNHIEGHIFSPFLQSKAGGGNKIQYPFLALIVSGGHTHLFYAKEEGRFSLLARTLDDAAGEAFDKSARLLGLKFPGGPQIEKQARIADRSDHRRRAGGKDGFFSKIKTKGLSFSFSGVKSAARRLVESHSSEWIKENRPFICADYQKTVVDHLMDKLDAAFQLCPVRQVVLGGGVAANGFLRQRFKTWADQKKTDSAVPELHYCTDNAAMTAFLATRYFARRKRRPLPCSPVHLKKDFFD